MNPVRAILLHSPGHKLWVIIVNIFMSPKGATQSKRKANTLAVSAAPKGALNFVPLFTQGFISGFALITPWALQEYRA